LGFDSYNLPSRPERANINVPRDSDGNTYLHELIRKDAPLERIREAAALGADLNAVNKKNMPPLGIAIQQGKPEVVACLLDLGAEIFFPVNKQMNFNAVYLAADTGRTAALNMLLAKGGGAYVNSPGVTQEGWESKWNPLHIAVKNYHDDMIAPLVAAGALVNEEAGSEHFTPLMLAILNNGAGGVRKVLNAGADLERRHSVTGRTPLDYAASTRSGAAARVLVEFGADVDAMDKTGLTPLMSAAENGDSGMAAILIEAGARIDLRRGGNNQETALMRAAYKGSSEVVKALLKAGADPILTDAFNNSALKYAENAYQHGTRFVLEEAEQKALQKHFENSYRKYRP
jgi:ankyrin repeat protein